jgi:hypothetical protein
MLEAAVTPMESFNSYGWWFWYVAVIHPFGILALVFGFVLCLNWWDDRKKRKAQERRRARMAVHPQRRFVSRRARCAATLNRRLGDKRYGNPRGRRG